MRLSVIGHFVDALPVAAGLLIVLAVTAAAGPASAQTLRDAAEGRFLIGTAAEPYELDNPKYAKILARQFSSVTAENAMKPAALHAKQGELTFGEADRLVAFAQEHGLEVIGHVLIWHQAAPDWMFTDGSGRPLPRDVALQNMREHIHAVAGHFRGKVRGWDVVNEAISDSGPYLRDTPALRAIGEDYVIKAFEFAHEADPDAELYYNDYNIDMPYKRDKGLRMVRELLGAGVRLDAVGIQGHWLLESPPLDEINDGIQAFIDLGVRVEITELDIDPLPRTREGGADVTAIEEEGDNPYVRGMPNQVQRQLAQRYHDLFNLFQRHPEISRVTLWGIDDEGTWLNNFPVQGRTNHPMLWDRELEPKLAYRAVLKSLQRGSR